MSADFDDAANYDRQLHQGLKLTGDDKAFYIEGRLASLTALLPGDFEPRTVLDFGCGSGDTTRRLAELFPNAAVTGYDVSRQIITQAAEQHAGARVTFTDELETIGAGSVDLCYSNGAFHHIPPPDRAGVLGRLFARCRPGAAVTVFENNPWNPGTRLVMRRIPFDRDTAPISAPQLGRILRTAGFETDGSRFLFVFPEFLRWLRPVERRISRAPLGGQYVVVARRPT